MITAQGNQLGLAFADGTDWCCPAQSAERLRHLLPGNVVIEGRDGDISAIDDFSPIRVGVDVGARVEAAK